jgi:hypothetical protein
MLNMDFSERLVVFTDEMDWIKSPAFGVSRLSCSNSA